MTVKG